MKKFFAACAVLLAFTIGIAQAHGGQTDENGGHYDYETGAYHYHHGYPAHYHTGGECPYDYDDKTGWNSGGSGGSGMWSYTSAPRPAANSVNHKQKQNGGPGIGFALFFVAVISCLIFFTYISVKAYQRGKEEDRKKEERMRMIREQEMAERETKKRKIVEYYSNNDLETIAGVAEMYVIGIDGLPAEREKEEHETYGKTLEVYINDGSNSYSYHRKGCRYARHMVNILDPNYNFHARNACGVCRPIKPPEVNWFAKYLEAEKKCVELGITPKHRAQ